MLNAQKSYRVVSLPNLLLMIRMPNPLFFLFLFLLWMPSVGKGEEDPPFSLKQIPTSAIIQNQSPSEPIPSNVIQVDASQSVEDGSKESKMLVQDPEFFQKQNPVGQHGMYFGVGFRRLFFNLRDHKPIFSDDAANNGIAFNFGYRWDNKTLEYGRQVSLISFDSPQIIRNHPFDLLEVLHNNFSFLISPQITNEWYFHYGTGIQLTEISFFHKNQTEVTSTETFVALLMGGSYFVTRNFFIQYRFSQGWYSPQLTGNNTHNRLYSTQAQTLFLQYYFTL